MKTCAIVDLFSAHDHIIPSHIGYLQELGYQVTVFSPTPDFQEVTKLLPDLKYDVVAIDADQYQGGGMTQFWDRLLNRFPLAQTLSEYDLVLLNTFRTELPVTNAISKRCGKVLAIMHTPGHGLRQRRYRNFLAAGHQGLVLSRSIGKTFDLPWFSPLTYADDRLLQTRPDGTQRVFCVPGTVRFSGRTYEALVDSVQKLNERGIDDFLVKIVGRSDNDDGRSFRDAIQQAGVEQYFRIVSDVSHEEFLQEVVSSDFVLPLIDKGEDIRGIRHYTEAITSSVFLAIGMGKNLVCERELAEAYQLGDVAISHDSRCLQDGLLAAMNTSSQALASRQQMTKDIRDDLLLTSAQNLEQAIRGLG